MNFFKIISTILLAVCLSGCAASQNTTNLKNAISMAETSQGKIFILYPDIRLNALKFIPGEYIDIYHNKSFSGTLNIGETIVINANKGTNNICFLWASEKMLPFKKKNLKVSSNQKNNIYIALHRTIISGNPTSAQSELKVISKNQWLKLANM